MVFFYMEFCMRKQFAIGTVLALGVMSAPAFADFSYSNAELSYLSVNADGPGGSDDGFGLTGSYEFNDNVSAFAGYEDIDGAEGSLKHLNLGVGFNWSLSDNLDVTSGLSYESFDSGPNATGFGLGLGLRGRVSDSFELTGGVKYYNLNKGWPAQTTFTVGARYYFTPNFAAGVDYSELDDLGSGFRVALRYDFGAK
jgi:opacity protein-like surface antigen